MKKKFSTLSYLRNIAPKKGIFSLVSTKQFIKLKNDISTWLLKVLIPWHDLQRMDIKGWLG
jgi:hypothetical protein